MDSDVRRLLAEALLHAEREYRAAQDDVRRADTDLARARYAAAAANYRRLEELLGLREPAPAERSNAPRARPLQTSALAGRVKLPS